MTPILSTTLLRTQSDERLVALARDGSERAFEAIVERYRKPLHRYCRRALPEARAEDAVQQVFLGAWSSLHAGTDVRDLRAWLYGIAHNVALNAARRAGYDHAELRDSLPGADGPDVDFERRTKIRRTLAGVAALPERQRHALLRTVVDGDSQSRVALELGLTSGAVRQLVHRARETLRSAATAVTPLPAASWAASAGEGGAPIGARISELSAAGSVGVVGALGKTAVVVVAAGVLASAPGALQGTLNSSGAAGTARAAAGDANSGGHEKGRGRGPWRSADPRSGAHHRTHRSPERVNRELRGHGGERNGERGGRLDSAGRRESGDGDASGGSGRSGESHDSGGSGDVAGSGSSGSGESPSGEGGAGPSSGAGGGEVASGSSSGSDGGGGGLTGESSSGGGPSSGSGQTSTSSGSTSDGGSSGAETSVSVDGSAGGD